MSIHTKYQNNFIKWSVSSNAMPRTITNQPTNKTKTKKAFTCLNMHCKYNYLLISTQNNNYICYFGVIRNQKVPFRIGSPITIRTKREKSQKNHFHQNLKQHKYTTNLFSRFDENNCKQFCDERGTNYGGDKMWLFVIRLSI